MNPFFSKLPLVVVVYHANRKVTDTVTISFIEPNLSPPMTWVLEQFGGETIRALVSLLDSAESCVHQALLCA